MSKNTKIIIAIIVVISVCKFLVGSILLGASGLYLLSTSSTSSTQYFLTINEVMSSGDKFVGKNIRISGAVIGESLKFNQATGNLSFYIAEVPGDYKQVEDQGGLASVLENAVSNPNLQRLQIIYSGEKPELLRNKAQAIITGQFHSDGVFYADEILLKCPSRYEEAVPKQAID